MARRFHPDTQTNPDLADLADKIEATFIRVNEAFEVLKDPGRRASYEAMLPRDSFQPPAAPPTAAPAPDAGATPAAPPQAADATPPGMAVVGGQVAELLGKANQHFKKEEYWDAIQILEPAIAHTEGKLKSKARLLLAKAYAKNPKWVKRAEEEIRELLAEDPRYAEGYFHLAMIYKEKGLASRARSMFKKVLALNPEHERAREELGPEPEDEPAQEKKGPGGGFLKRLFKNE